MFFVLVSSLVLILLVLRCFDYFGWFGCCLWVLVSSLYVAFIMVLEVCFESRFGLILFVGLF